MSINNEDKNQKEIPFYDRPFEEVEDGFIDDRGFYTTPNGSFWDEDNNYFNHLGFDCHGGFYDKYGIYHPGPNYDEINGLYQDQKEFISPSGMLNTKKIIDLSIKKLKEQDKNDTKILKKYENLEEESENSEDEDKSNITYDEEDFKEAYKNVIDQQIELSEILNPQVYTGITERDFHLFLYKPQKQPEYVHVEANEIPICGCRMHNKDIDLEIGEICPHVLFVLNDILQLDTRKEKLIYSENELEKAFEKAEKKYKNMVRETYGIVKRKNFNFPNPKFYKYEYDIKNENDENAVNEWRIKERLYARGIVADEFMFPGLSYSLVEDTYNKYFFSEKEANPTQKAFEKKDLTGRQLELDKIYS